MNWMGLYNALSLYTGHQKTQVEGISLFFPLFRIYFVDMNSESTISKQVSLGRLLLAVGPSLALAVCLHSIPVSIVFYFYIKKKD